MSEQIRSVNPSQSTLINRDGPVSVPQSFTEYHDHMEKAKRDVFYPSFSFEEGGS